MSIDYLHLSNGGKLSRTARELGLKATEESSRIGQSRTVYFATPVPDDAYASTIMTEDWEKIVVTAPFDGMTMHIPKADGEDPGSVADVLCDALKLAAGRARNEWRSGRMFPDMFGRPRPLDGDYRLVYRTAGDTRLVDQDEFCSGEESYVDLRIYRFGEAGVEDAIDDLVDQIDFIPEDWVSDWGDGIDALLEKHGWRRDDPWPAYGENVEAKVHRITAALKPL